MNKIPIYLSLRQYVPLQILFVVTIIAVLLSIASKEYDVPKIKARMTESLTIASVLKQEITLFHAIQGTWPDREDLQYVFRSTEGDELYPGVEIKNGSFKIAFDTHNVKLGMREIAFHRVEVPGEPSATIMWECGYNDKSTNLIVHKEFNSNLEERFMLSICKDKAN